MTVHSGCRIDLDAINRRFDEFEDEISIEFVPDEPRGLGFVDAMLDAILAADGTVPPEHSAAGLTITIDGAATGIDYYIEDVFVTWVSGFAEAMRAQGYTGLIRPVPSRGLPRWYYDVQAPLLTTFMAYDDDFVDAVMRGHGTFVDRELRRQRGPVDLVAPPAVARWFDHGAAWGHPVRRHRLHRQLRHGSAGPADRPHPAPLHAAARRPRGGAEMPRR